jgi:hypothetical protein
MPFERVRTLRNRWMLGWAAFWTLVMAYYSCSAAHTIRPISILYIHIYIAVIEDSEIYAHSHYFICLELSMQYKFYYAIVRY